MPDEPQTRGRRPGTGGDPQHHHQDDGDEAKGTVSGRTYKATRKRGFIDWKPRKQTVDLMEAAEAVLDEYIEQGSMTARQVFYALVGRVVIDKTENSYDRLCEVLSKARRAGLIPMHRIRDDGVAIIRARGWGSPEELLEVVRKEAINFRPRGLDNQPYFIEVHVEATGMAPMVANFVGDFGIDVYSSGGFNSVASKYQMAERLSLKYRPAVILHIGDHDPSGCSILDSLAEDVDAFYAQNLHAEHGIDWVRVAVTPEQIGRYNLPTAPQKKNDRRGERMAETVQTEALTPAQLEDEVRRAVFRYLDLDIYNETLAQAAVDRDRLLNSGLLDILDNEDDR